MSILKALSLFLYFKEDKSMSNLKEKLSQKIQKSKEETMSTKELINEAETIYENGSKITKLVPNEVSVTGYFVPEFAITLNEAKERTQMLQSFVKDMMIPNVDFGIIPKCNKPSLLKPGAEKLCEIFGFSKQVEILNRIEDWEKGLFHYEVKVILISKRTGLVEAEGLGCCNSMERKFKSQDSYSIVNTILKMSKKRALIDAVLSATRSSSIFTQDIEEMSINTDEQIIQPNKASNSNKAVQQTVKQSPALISKEQQTEIFSVIKHGKIPVNYAKGIMFERYNIEESSKLTSEQADEFIDILKCCQAV